MQDEGEPDDDRPDPPSPSVPGAIAALTEEERAMLREFAGQLRDREVRNLVAREALDRAADQLERVAAATTSDEA